MKNIVTASFLIIGDEILSGRTADKNLNFLAKNLTKIGVILLETRVVPDKTTAIFGAINSLRKKYDYVFTSGGIGPTHDDITADAVAKSFGVPLIKNKKAMEILNFHYGKENINDAKMKMAFIPNIASLLDNPVSSAPGFRIKNVFVMAGVPKIFRAMFRAARKELVCGAKILSKEIKVFLTESLIAKDLEDLQKKYPQISIGSYPFENRSGKGTALVFRGSNYAMLEKSYQEMKNKL
jgi:molybdenum cofactor synthesis domain-containing protein